MMPSATDVPRDLVNPKPSDSQRTTQYVFAVVILCVATVASVVTLKWIAPEDITTGNLIIGIMGPIVAAFMAAALQGVHKSVNSRMDTFIASNDAVMEKIVAAAKEEGIKIGQQQGRIAADRRTDELASQQTASIAAPAAPAPAATELPQEVVIKNANPIPVTPVPAEKPKK